VPASVPAHFSNSTRQRRRALPVCFGSGLQRGQQFRQPLYVPKLGPMNLQRADKQMILALDQGMFTAAVLLVQYRGRSVQQTAYGTLGGTETEQVDLNTLFDLASLTKVLATTPAWILLAANEPEILDQSISRWFSDLPRDKARITPRFLLAHSSGLPAWRPHYLSWGQRTPDLQYAAKTILSEPLEYSPGAGSIYSDLGFMVLACIIEMEAGESFEAFCRTRIYRPLSIDRDMLFKPLGEERRVAWTRAGEPPGLVNDLNARSLGGVSGHAGLFGTAHAVATVAAEILTAVNGREGFFNPAIVQVFGHRAGFVQGSTRALGFDTPSAEGSSSGRFFSAGSLGHTGFTGTSLWLDPKREVVVVLLTNRVIMGEADLRIRGFRPLLHDAIGEDLVDGQ
jgi:serine-type D-Ala-D-Ala carboxypeptidase